MIQDVKKSSKKNYNKKNKNEFTDRDRDEYRKIARDLGYSKEVQKAIKNATSEIQCEQILIGAREKN